MRPGGPELNAFRYTIAALSPVVEPLHPVRMLESGENFREHLDAEARVLS